MSTKYIASNWRLPNQENSSKNDNYGLTYNGSNEYIDTGDAFTSLTSFSISAWFKSDDTSTAAQAIVSSRINSIGTSQGLDLYVSSNTLVSRVFNNGATEVTTAFTDTASWHHVVMTYNGTTLELFLDNVSQGTATGVYTNSAANWLIGKWNAGANYFDGSISELAVFDYALTSTQISTLYGSSSLGSGNPMALKPQPVAYYPLGDNSASNPLTQPNVAVEDATVFDFSGSNQWIDCGVDSSIDTGDLSVAFWFNKDSSASGYQYVFNSGSGSAKAGFVFAFSGTNIYIGRKTRTHTAGFTTYTNIGISADKWHHIALTYNDTSNNFIAYLDGQSVHTSTGASATNAASSEIIFGRISNVASSYYKGKVSNAQIWQAELSSTEVETLYNSGVPLYTGTQPQAANLKSWYKLNNTANWEADSTGNWQIPEATSAYPQSFDFISSPQQIIHLGTDNTTFKTTSAFSFSLWVNFSSAAIGNYRGLFSTTTSGNGYLLWKTNGNQLAFLVRDGVWKTASSSTTLAAGEWHHVVCTWDGSSTSKIYVDSVVGGTTSNPSTVDYAAGTQTKIGNYGAYNMDGQMSNFQFWDSELSQANVETLYNNGSPLTTAIASSNLKAWYKLNNNEIFDGTNWEVENQKYPANYESALSFDGSNDYVDTGAASFSGLTEMSVSAWVKPTATGTGAAEAILSTEASSPNRGFYLSLFILNEFRWQVSTDGSNKDSLDGGTISLNEWTHIVATWNQSTMNLYVNGSLADTMSTVNATGTFSTTNNMFIGQRTSGAGYFPGDISNVAFYNTVLDSSAVTALYNNGTPETSISSSPVSWWKLNNLTTGIQDSTGSNDGTNNGATKVNTFVSTEAATSSGMTEQNLVNNNVSALNGKSSGMTSANLVTSDLTRAIPYDNYSFTFDGVDDIIEIPRSTDLEPVNITVSCWVNVSASGSHASGYFLNKMHTSGNSVSYGIYKPSAPTFLIKVGGVTKYSPAYGTDIQGQGWHHLLGTYDGANIRLYVNGIEVGTGTAETGAIQYTTEKAYIGSFESASLEINGKISNCSIFNEALTSTEVLKLYSNGVPQDLSSFTPQPVAWYTLGSNSFWNGSNWICRDLIGSNDGTSANIGADGLVGDAPRSEANGTGTNMDVPSNLEGNTKWSSNNSYSVNMSSLARVEDVA